MTAIKQAQTPVTTWVDLLQAGPMSRQTYFRVSRDPWIRSYLKPENSKEIAEPLVRAVGVKELTDHIKALIAQGLGDGSIAVRLNNRGITCKRSDVYLVRNGRRPPEIYGSFEE